MRKLLITGAALLSITGCASTLDGERARLSSSETIEQQRVPFEANLDKVNGKWDLDFAERGDVMYDHVRGLWIHRAAELPSMGCIRGFLGLTAKERCAKNMGIPYGEWVESDPGADMLSNVLVTPVVTALSPFGLLNAALGGENNFMWGFLGIGSDHQFSWKGFADSLEQAKENEAGSVEEYDRQLASLLRDLHQLEQEVAAFNESRRAAEYYSAQAEDHTKAKFAELKADAGRALNLQVVDNSGLWSKLDAQIDAGRAVVFEIPTPAAPEFVDERHTMEAVVPARSLDELEENIRKARQAFAEAKTGGENVRSDNEAALADHQRKVELHDGPIQLRRAANANPARADLRWQLPQLAVRKGRVVGDGTVKVVVTSVDFVNVRPAYFAAHNNELRIVQENGVITLTNRSDHYVTVDAVSLYHQAKILTQSNSADGLLELPPQSVSTLRLASFDLHSLEDDYRQFDVRKAERESVKYGFGVKYRMTGAGVSKVLYKTDDYDLLPLL